MLNAKFKSFAYHPLQNTNQAMYCSLWQTIYLKNEILGQLGQAVAMRAVVPVHRQVEL